MRPAGPASQPSLAFYMIRRQSGAMAGSVVGESAEAGHWGMAGMRSSAKCTTPFGARPNTRLPLQAQTKKPRKDLVRWNP